MQYKYELVQTDHHLPLKIIVHSSNQPVHVPMHWHDSVEISYVLSGKIDDIYIDGTHYSSMEGDIVLINSNALHSFTSSNHGGSEAVTFLIPYDFISACLQASDLILFDCISIAERNPHRLRDLAGLRKLLNSLLISYLTQHKNPLAHIQLTALTYQLIYVLLKNFQTGKREQPSVTTSKYRDRLLSINNYINDHYDENLSLEQIADNFELSSQYLSRFFIKHMGMTVFQYINDLRLEKAYRDLMNTDQSILHIAIKHGFPNEKSLIRVFKKEYGVTPHQYRKAHKGNFVMKDWN